MLSSPSPSATAKSKAAHYAKNPSACGIKRCHFTKYPSISNSLPLRNECSARPILPVWHWWCSFSSMFFLLGVHFGVIQLNFNTEIGTDVLNMLKYILLTVSLLFFFFIIICKYFVTWLFKKRYLFSVFVLLFVSFIIFSLCEAVGIYGLVVFLLSRNPADFFLFFAISLCYFYYFFPNFENWETLLNQEKLEQ